MNCKREDRRGRRLWFHLRSERYRSDEQDFATESESTKGRIRRLRQAIAIFNSAENPGRALQYASPEQVGAMCSYPRLHALGIDDK